MKRMIIAFDREAALKQRSEYETTVKKRNAERKAYDNALKACSKQIKSIIESVVGSLSIDIEVWARAAGNYEDNLVLVDVYSNTEPLTWSHEVLINKRNGAVQEYDRGARIRSNVTSKDMPLIEDAVRCIELLNEFDWGSITDVLPDIDDYLVTPRAEDTGFEDDLFLDDLQDAISKGKLLHGASTHTHWDDAWYNVVDETSTSYVVQEIPPWGIDKSWPDKTKRISKQRFYELIGKGRRDIEALTEDELMDWYNNKYNK